jgi:hypothetical protein
MGSQHEQTERIEALRSLIERLGAPDLTLSEAKVLQGRLSDLLEWDTKPGGSAQMAPSPALAPPQVIGDGPRHIAWSPETPMRAAG